MLAHMLTLLEHDVLAVALGFVGQCSLNTGCCTLVTTVPQTNCVCANVYNCRDDVSLSSAGQLLQQSSAALPAPTEVEAAPTAVPPAAAQAAAAPAPTAAGASAGGAQTVSSFRFSGGLHGGDVQSRGLQLRVARPSNASGARESGG